MPRSGESGTAFTADTFSSVRRLKLDLVSQSFLLLASSSMSRIGTRAREELRWLEGFESRWD